LEEVSFFPQLLAFGAPFDAKVRAARRPAIQANITRALDPTKRLQAWKEIEWDYMSRIVNILKEEIA
jgi:hypothetical protein